MDIEDVQLLAKKFDSKLQATDPRLQRSVQLIHRDGTMQFLDRAFLLKMNKWIAVFTEHHGYRVYHTDELLRYLQFGWIARIQKLEDALENQIKAQYDEILDQRQVFIDQRAIRPLTEEEQSDFDHLNDRLAELAFQLGYRQTVEDAKQHLDHLEKRGKRQ